MPVSPKQFFFKLCIPAGAVILMAEGPSQEKEGKTGRNWFFYLQGI